MKKKSKHFFKNYELIKNASLNKNQKDKKELFENNSHNNSSNFNNKKENNENTLLDNSPSFNVQTPKNKIFKKRTNLYLKKSIFNSQIISNYSKINILILIIISFMTTISKSENIRKLNEAYEIKMVHLNTGIQEIIFIKTLPEKVIVNGENKDLSLFPYVDLGEKEKSVITIVWNSLPPCKEMFKNMGFIEYIDLSNFDASEVTDMTEMFCSCSSLKINKF